MALQITRRAKGWDGNIAGDNTVELSLPIGFTYHQTTVEYAFLQVGPAGLALGDAVGEVRLVANGKPIWNLQAVELDKKNRYEGRVTAGDADSGVLVIDYDRFGLRMRGMEEFTSLGTGVSDDETPLTTLTIEMDLKPAVVSGTLKSRHIVSASRKLGLFKKLRRYTDVFTGAGEFEIDDFPKGDAINAVLFFESVEAIINVRLERDDFVMFDRTDILNSRLQVDGVRAPQDFLYVYDTTEKGNGQDQLLTRNANGTRVNDMRWFMTISGALTITSIVEYMGALEF